MVYDRLFERLIKVPIIEEDIWIVKPSVEVPFHRFYGLDHTFQLLIPCQNHQRRVRSWSICLGLEATGHEDFVVILTYFPAVQSEYALIS